MRTSYPSVLLIYFVLVVGLCMSAVADSGEGISNVFVLDTRGGVGAHGEGLSNTFVLDTREAVNQVIFHEALTSPSFESDGIIIVLVTPLEVQFGKAIDQLKSLTQKAQELEVTGWTVDPPQYDIASVVVRVPTSSEMLAQATGMLFDSSGSMADSDPNLLRIDAGKRYLDELQNDDLAAVFDFGPASSGGLDQTRLLQGFTNDQTLLETAIDKVTADGQTPMYASIQSVAQYIDGQLPGNDFVRALLFFADGDPTDEGFNDAVQAAIDARLPIIGVGLGPAAEGDPQQDTDAVAVMRDLTDATNGIYVPVLDPSQMESVFGQLGDQFFEGQLVIELKLDPIPQPGTLLEITLNTNLGEIRFFVFIGSLTPPGEAPITFPIDQIHPAPGQDKIVVLTHGWLGPSGDGDQWISPGREAIVGEIDGSQWDVETYDWPEYADPLPRIVPRATLLGKKLGQDIAEHDFEHIHLIGHSAGSWVISEAARVIKDIDNGATVHLTFLDAYVPGSGVVLPGSGQTEIQMNAELLGQRMTADWADHYYVDDFRTGENTGVDLPNAFNVNLSTLDRWINSHSFPHQWYRETVSDPSIGNRGQAFGFVRSLEGGGPVEWGKSIRLPRVGAAIRLRRDIFGEYEFTSGLRTDSATGSIFVDSNGIHLHTGSPVWFTSHLNLPSGANFISFRYQFQGIAQGYLSVYLNNELLYLGDQRVDGNDEVDAGDIILGGMLQKGDLLGVRLDAMDENIARVFISDLEFGSFTVEAAAYHWQLYR